MMFKKKELECHVAHFFLQKNVIYTHFLRWLKDVILFIKYVH